MLRKIFFLFIVFFFIFPSVVIAQDATSNATLLERQNRTLQRQDIKERAKAEYERRRDEFKSRVQEIRDSRKKALVERIDIKISTFNKKMTDRMSSAVDKLSSVLLRIEENYDSLISAGVDTQDLKTLIDNARNALERAKEAIANQADKEYIAVISGDASLRENIGQTVSLFRNDIKDTYQAVIEAKQAIVEAAKKLMMLKRMDGARDTLDNSL